MSEFMYVKCPECENKIRIEIDESLEEDSVVEGFGADCEKCGVVFTFDVYLDVMNKVRL